MKYDEILPSYEGIISETIICGYLWSNYQESMESIRRCFLVCRSNERSNYSDLLPQKGSWGRDMGPLSQGNLGWWNMKIWPAKHLNFEWLEFQVTSNHGPFKPFLPQLPFGYCSTVPTTGQWKRAPRCLGYINTGLYCPVIWGSW